jgi:hypothetical protein
MPAPKLSNKTVIGIKTETTQNTAATLAATDFVLAGDVEINPVSEAIERDFKRFSLDTLPHLVGKRHYEVKFKMELKGSGTRGTAYAPLGAALQACAFIETVSEATSVVYSRSSTPASANFFSLGKACTIEIYKDGHKHVIAGCIGNGKISAPKAGEPAMLECDFKGLYLDPTDAAPPTQTYSAILPPQFASATISLLTVAHIISSFEVDFGNAVSMRDNAAMAYGVGGFMITKWDPKGGCDPEAVPLATDTIIKDYMDAVSGAFSVSFGATSGNIVALSMPCTQYTGAPYADKNGILIHKLGLVYRQSSGDDAITITLT